MQNSKLKNQKFNLEGKSFYLAIVIVTFAFCFLNLKNVSAQESVRTFTISPPAVEVELAPGERTEGKLKIINDGENSLNFNTSIRDFIVTDDLGTPDILPVNTLANKYSGASWVAVYPNQVYVSPRQKTEFTYYIQVPIDARPGGHYAAVVYTPTTIVAAGQKTGAAVNTSVGSLFYITVKGPVTEKATVTKFTTKKIWESAPEILTTQIMNGSDIHISPKGGITITNMLGKQSDFQELPKSNIFPGASRSYHTTVGKGFMLGRYTAKFNGTFGKANPQTLIATTTFWVIPWKILIVLIGIIIAVAAGWVIMKKRNGKDHNPPGSPQNQPQSQPGV